MRGDLNPVVVFAAQALGGGAANRFEVRGVTVQQPFQAFLDIQDVGHAYDQMSFGLQHPRELAHRLLRIFDMLETFEAGDIVERSILKR